jgi:hypothetical protein
LREVFVPERERLERGQARHRGEARLEVHETSVPSEFQLAHAKQRREPRERVAGFFSYHRSRTRLGPSAAAAVVVVVVERHVVVLQPELSKRRERVQSLDSCYVVGKQPQALEVGTRV